MLYILNATQTVSYAGRVGDSTTFVVLDTCPRAVVPSVDDGVTLSQIAVVVFEVFTCARLRDARLAADGMFDACTLLQYTLNAFRGEVTADVCQTTETGHTKLAVNSECGQQTMTHDHKQYNRDVLIHQQHQKTACNHCTKRTMMHTSDEDYSTYKQIRRPLNYYGINESKIKNNQSTYNQ